MIDATNGNKEIERKPGIAGRVWNAGTPAFAIVLAAFAALYIPVIPAMLDEIIMSYSYSQNLLFPAMAAGLLWYERKRLAGAARTKSQAGLVLAAIGLIVYSAALASGKFVTARYAMLFAGLGAALWFYGPGKLTRAWGPVALVFLTVPIHNMVTQKIIVPLTEWDRLASAKAVVRLVNLIGVPAWREGLNLHVPGAVLYVAITCSGMNFVINLAVIAILIMYITKGSAGRKAAFLMCVPFIGILANTARIAANLCVAYKLGASEGYAFFHNYGGLIFNAVAALAALAIMKAAGLTLPEKGGGQNG